jgi:hypothetical protein
MEMGNASKLDILLIPLPQFATLLMTHHSGLFRILIHVQWKFPYCLDLLLKYSLRTKEIKFIEQAYGACYCTTAALLQLGPVNL